MAGDNFTFQPLTMGQLLKLGQLKVPPNQRSYAWRDKQVRYLLQDLNEAIYAEAVDDYFLGTIVIVASGDLPSIVDGQQRLATTSILLARIRDMLLEAGRDKSALSIDQAYLTHIDINTEQAVSRIQMNEENNQFYSTIILPPAFASRYGAINKGQLRLTNRRLVNASKHIDGFLRNVVNGYPPDRRIDQLIRWENFIDKRAKILTVFVSDEFAAYRMFETLNDRGLRASQVDILKNYLFSRCQTRLEEAKAVWREIDTLVEPLGSREESEEDDVQDNPDKSSDPLINFVRHFWVTGHGPTKGKELAERIRAELTNETRAITFLTNASLAARDYVAIAKADDQKWKMYPATARQDIATLNDHLRVTQIKPLVLAIAHYLVPVEAAKALQLCVSWSVRFLIAGGRGGMLDTQYSRRAHEIGTGKITKARDLREAMKQYVPSNEEFEQAFSVARVSRSWLARYLIRAVEKQQKNLPHPEYIENEEVADVNLEHILPVTPSDGWGVDEEVAEAMYNQLGNMAIVSVAMNKAMGNMTFPEKKPILAKSGYTTTKWAAEYEGDEWGKEQILDRQQRLASYAAATWPLEFKGK